MAALVLLPEGSDAGTGTGGSSVGAELDADGAGSDGGGSVELLPLANKACLSLARARHNLVLSA